MAQQKEFKRRMGGLHTYPERIQTLQPGITPEWKRATVPTHERVLMLCLINLSLIGPFFAFILMTDPVWGVLPFKDNPDGWQGLDVLEDPGVPLDEQ